MPLNAYGKNAALAGAATKMLYMGLFTSAAYAPTSNTVIGASLINLTGAKAKGFTNGKIVVIRKLTGSVTGLIAERQYFVVGETTNGFELAVEEGGTAVKVAGHELETASSEFALLTECTGGSYKRVKATWGTPAGGEMSDTAAEAIKGPGVEAEVTDAGWFEKESGGTGATGVQAVAKLPVPKKLGPEDMYTVESDKLENNTTP